LELPLHGVVEREEFLKEELIEFWEGISRRQGVRPRTGVEWTGLEGSLDRFRVQTSAGTVGARRVLLALGRRGVPRKLGVPGEEQEKVLYRLIDAATYRGESLLVVGGGDSAIEAALALAEQPGNRVVLSYRRPSFFRLKARNEERIERAIADRRVEVKFESQVTRIDPSTVTLRIIPDDREVTLPNSGVFVFAGGEAPRRLLQQVGVRFGGPEPAVAATSALAARG